MAGRKDVVSCVAKQGSQPGDKDFVAGGYKQPGHDISLSFALSSDRFEPGPQSRSAVGSVRNDSGGRSLYLVLGLLWPAGRAWFFGNWLAERKACVAAGKDL